MRHVDGCRRSWLFRLAAPDGKLRERKTGHAARNNITETGKSLTMAREGAEKSRLMGRYRLGRCRVRGSSPAAAGRSHAMR
jgi:hypothetical protein